jgi:hypothetical protein
LCTTLSLFHQMQFARLLQATLSHDHTMETTTTTTITHAHCKPQHE